MKGRLVREGREDVWMKKRGAEGKDAETWRQRGEEAGERKQKAKA